MLTTSRRPPDMKQQYRRRGRRCFRCWLPVSCLPILLIISLVISHAEGQFFTKSQKSLPRMGRRAVPIDSSIDSEVPTYALHRPRSVSSQGEDQERQRIADGLLADLLMGNPIQGHQARGLLEGSKPGKLSRRDKRLNVRARLVQYLRYLTDEESPDGEQSEHQNSEDAAADSPPEPQAGGGPAGEGGTYDVEEVTRVRYPKTATSQAGNIFNEI